MATNPNFTAAVRTGIGQISSANTNRDGSGATATIITGAANGTRIDSVVVKATATTTAGMVRLYVSDGSNVRLWREIAVSAITPSASLATFTAELLATDSSLPLLLLPFGYSLQASTHIGEAFNVIATGGDF